MLILYQQLQEIAMSTTIICVGQSVCPVKGKYNSAGFDAAVAASQEAAILPYNGKQYNPADRVVLLGEGRLARETADQMILPCKAEIDPLLNEIPLRSFMDTDREYPAETWIRKAAGQRKHGDVRQSESRMQVIERADRLIEKIQGKDCILVTYPLFLAELLDQLRIHSYVVQRTGMLKIQPLERFVISRKDEHCGGCQHNCFLSNPGCGVGRDKAMRKGLQVRS